LSPLSLPDPPAANNEPVNPDILIVDEVLSVGDELFRRKSFAKMEEFFKSGKTVLYVSHSANSVNELCSRAILIDNGDLILDGPSKLVTMNYQKYLFSKPALKKKLRDEIIVLNKKLSQGEIEIKPEITSQTKEKKIKIDPDEKDDESRKYLKDYYLQEFKPKSTVVTKNDNIEVEDIDINTLSGKKVNVLVMNSEYIFTYKVKFGADAEKVKFSMAIRTEKGLLITSSISPVGDHYLDKVLKGDEYVIGWKFKCGLLVGNYYTNIGVRSYADEKRKFLYRAVDASVFKVQGEKDKKYYGLVNLEQTARIEKIN